MRKTAGARVRMRTGSGTLVLSNYDTFDRPYAHLSPSRHSSLYLFVVHDLSFFFFFAQVAFTRWLTVIARNSEDIMRRRRCVWSSCISGFRFASFSTSQLCFGTSNAASPPVRREQKKSVAYGQRRRRSVVHPSRAPSHAVRIELGNGISASVDVPVHRNVSSTSRTESRASATWTKDTEPQALTNVPASSAVVGDLGGVSSSRENLLSHAQASLHSLSQYEALCDDYTTHCPHASRVHFYETRHQLVCVALPRLLALSQELSPAPEVVEEEEAVAVAVAADGEVHSTAQADQNETRGTTEVAVVTAEQRLDVMLAQEQLLAWLGLIETTSAHTARRYEPAMPAPLVAALWVWVMPVLHHLHSTAATTNAEQKQCYRRLRRKLALRARDVVATLPPELCVHVLTRMQQCRALADDVMGSVVERLLVEQRHHLARIETAAQSRQQHPNQNHGHDGDVRFPLSSATAFSPAGPAALNYSLLSHTVHPVAAHDARHLLFQGADAVTMVRLVARAHVPRHFQIHTFVHTVLLPVVRDELHRTRVLIDAARESQTAIKAPLSTDNDDMDLASSREPVWSAWLPSRAALMDITRCFVGYAVSGQAAEDLIALWCGHLQDTAQRLGSGGIDGVQHAFHDCAEILELLSVTHPSSSSSRMGTAAAQEVGLEDYLPLVERTCADVLRWGSVYLQSLSHTASSVTPPAHTPPLTVSTAMGVLRGLLGVDSVQWHDAYVVAATVALDTVRRECPTGTPHTGLVHEMSRFLRAARRRRGQLPDHPLHSFAARLVLHSSVAEKDATVAGSGLLSLALFASDVIAHGDSAAHAMPDKVLPHQNEDAVRVHTLLRLHGVQLPLTAFAAAITRAPLAQLSLAEQTQLVQQLTASASAVSPTWLARAIIACVDGLPDTVMDPVSLHSLCSRFTARDVVRRLPLEEASGLLLVVSRDEAASTNNALAKAALVRRVSIALRRDMDSPAHSQLDVLMALPRVVDALSRSNTFFIYLFSRACRVLLGQVEHAPWPVLLPAFTALAEEYTRRPPAQSRGTVFRDAWELLRGRVLEAASSPASYTSDSPQSHSADIMTLDDVLQALNAFAVLDILDYPVFSTLVYALTSRCRQAFEMERDDGRDSATHDPDDDSLPTTHTIDLPHGEGEARHQDALRTRARAQLGEHILSRLSDSAVAVVAAVLLPSARTEAEVIKPSEHALTVWVLLALPQRARQLYPMDVVVVLTHLVRFVGASDLSSSSSPPTARSELVEIAHRAYDACRSMFLLMYEHVDADTVETSGKPSGAGLGDTAVIGDIIASESERKQLALQRTQWPAKALASLHAVPRPLFADLLNEVTASGWLDRAVALACAGRICVRRVCQTQLTIQQLVGVAMALSAQLQEDSATAELNGLQRFLPVVLDALWARTDELSTVQISALLRFLRHQYGSKLDEDFVARLVAQRELLEKSAATAKTSQRNSHDSSDDAEKRVACAGVEENNQSAQQPSAPRVAVVAQEQQQKRTVPAAVVGGRREDVTIAPDDLFDLMVL